MQSSRSAPQLTPRIGCDRAGGKWTEVEAIIERTLCARGVEVYVYDLPGQPFVQR